MAEDKSAKRPSKKTETLRQRAERASNAGQPRVRRLKNAGSKVGQPFKAAHRIGKKEYYLPLPDNRVGRFLNKRRRLFPRYFKESWQELRKVEWPDKRMTARLTTAVFIFSTFLILIVTVIDFGLDKVFRKVFL